MDVHERELYWSGTLAVKGGSWHHADMRIWLLVAALILSVFAYDRWLWRDPCHRMEFGELSWYSQTMRSIVERHDAEDVRRSAEWHLRYVVAKHSLSGSAMIDEIEKMMEERRIEVTEAAVARQKELLHACLIEFPGR